MRPKMQMGPCSQSVLAVSSARTAMMHTSYQNHLPASMLMRLHIRHNHRCAKVTKSRCYRAHNQDISIASKLWNMRVVVLENSERQREAYYSVSLSPSAQRCDEPVPQSNASNTKAATSSLYAAGPPSVGASACPVSSPCTISCPTSIDRVGGGRSSASGLASTGRGYVTGVNSISSIEQGIVTRKL